MSAAGIALTIAGQQVDLSDVTWTVVAPCGCVSGLLTAFTNSLVVVTAEQAEDEFYDSKREREKYRKLGFTFEPRIHAAACDAAKVECEHEPRFGYSIPKPDGMVWAVGGYYGKRTSVLHLVSKDQATDREGRGGWVPATALCGQSQHHWTREWHLTTGLVECSRCLKATS